jgi:NitT/TauT family transport system substrate-binding protein
MNRNRVIWISIIAISLVIFSVGACSRSEKLTNLDPLQPVTIKIAVLPIMDTLPMFAAEKEGLFAEYNVQVEFIPVASAPERDQLVAAGQADGMVNEILSTMFYNRDAIQVQTVRYARTATESSPLFHILASGQSGFDSVDDLKNVEIGISEGTVIAYLTDRILESQSFAQDEIRTVAVPKISDRLALLASGELSAAMLPDPLSFLAEQQGGRIIVDDTVVPELSFSTISFRINFIEQNPEAVRGFLAALEESTKRINADPNLYASLLSERQLVPQPILEAYRINPYPEASIPSQMQWDDVLKWALDKGLLDRDISYAASVTDAFLP